MKYWYASHRNSIFLLSAVFAFSSRAFGQIKLGQSADYSGVSAALTKDMAKGINAHLKSVNDRGGIGGERVELVVLDDAFKPEKTVENTRALAERDDILALVGYRGTVNVTSVVPLLKQYNIALIGNTSGVESLRDPVVRELFHLRAGTKDEIETLIDHATTIGMRRIALVAQDDAFGKEAVSAANASLKQKNLVPVASAVIPRGTSDVVAAVAALSKANAEMVLVIGQAKPAAALITAVRATGLRPSFYVLSLAAQVG
ncbi:MAG: ABC transporter substrate-binding protein, partial [Casimicrobium sp.]